ncbi:MAG: hypothetical protein U0174_15955 [Polyangiaceae bacterium]
MLSIQQPRRARRRAGLALFATASTLVALASCQEPTQVYLLLRSDMPCGLPPSEGYGVREVRIFVAPDEATLRNRVESGLASATLSSCKGPGELGTIALVRENSDSVYVKVITSLDQRLASGSAAPSRNVADCPSEGGNEKASARCLVSSRRFQYTRHTTQYLPITLEESCVPQWWQCPAGKTCISGTCQSDDVPLSSEVPPIAPKPRTDGGSAESSVADVTMPEASVDADTADYPVEMSLGDFHTCALYKRGDVRCWGLGLYGQLGQGNTANVGIARAGMENLPRIDLPANDPAVAISAGGFRTCAALQSGRLLCWGWDGGEFGVPAGVLGYTGAVPNARGDAPGEIASLPTGGVLAANKAVKRVSVSLGAHTCAWNDMNQVWCWGQNDHGQLGTGDKQERVGGPAGLTNLVAVAIGAGDAGAMNLSAQFAVGNRHSCAIVPPSGTVRCWGANASPFLGLLGAESNTPFATTPFDSKVTHDGAQAVQIGAGQYHTCALLKTQANTFAVRCWGTNDYGQLGTNSTVYYGGVPGNYGSYSVEKMKLLPQVVFPQGATADLIAVGPFHNCARMQSDHKKVVCWGRNNAGQLGDGAAGDALVRGNSSLNSVASAPPLTFPSRVVRLAAGGDNVSGKGHSCALLEDHSMWCWGNNGDRVGTTIPRFGQLGVASTQAEVLVPTQVVAPLLPP